MQITEKSAYSQS